MTFSNERTTSGEQAVDLQEGYNACIILFWHLLFNIIHVYIHRIFSISLIIVRIVNPKIKMAFSFTQAQVVLHLYLF